jgi:hypothetical protein
VKLIATYRTGFLHGDQTIEPGTVFEEEDAAAAEILRARGFATILDAGTPAAAPAAAKEPTYEELKARAKELDLPATGKKAELA